MSVGPHITFYYTVVFLTGVGEALTDPTVIMVDDKRYTDDIWLQKPPFFKN